MSKIKNTLIDLIAKNFIEINKKSRLKSKNRKNYLRKNIAGEFSISAVLINSALKEVKGKSKETLSKKEVLEETTEEESKNNRGIINGGYGAISKHYGISPGVKYSDYSSIWSHLGSFRTYNAYEGLESSNSAAIKNGESSREMISLETIDKAAKHFKYFVVGDVMGDIGFVPPVGSGIDSKEWEKYRLMTQMSIYQPFLKLKMASA
ncbi:hypothetical protein KY347_05910 [Candidatus Woesearchaeota archaeon]|nr:hypothetical protein [Candidatus Woesearchaeota archaeon]